jgi:ArsR family transcriptional regulator
MPEHETFQLASRLLKAASDPIRAKILYALSEAELCVCEVAELLGTSLSLASHHLRILREADLIRPRKQGKLVFYILQRQAMNGMVHRLVTSFARDERRKRR